MSGIGPIAAVTIAAPELQRSIDAWHLYLGYQLTSHERLTPDTAEAWGRPGLAGRHYALMLPEGSGSTYVRFIESRPAPAYRPFRHFGWNAAELMVQDTDAAAARLGDSPFRIIGPPANLSFSDKIRAMQAIGPAGEAVYLTSFAEKLAAFDVPDAKHFIDRVFIVILGGVSCESINAFYSRHFGVAEAAVMPVVISVLSEAHGLPASTKHPLAALSLSGQCYIEADAMPAGTTPRTAEPGELPPAIAMVTFVVPRLPDGAAWLAPPRRLPEAPYHGRLAGVCEGPAGELIELIEGS
jgi:catechol 2,3-dioxygenase-like lactoylglutathione lyase family enzyme